MLRRDFLKASAAAVGCAPLLLPSELFAQERNAHVPKVLWAKRGRDEFRVDFSTQQGYMALSWLLRDVKANVVGKPDFDLLTLLAWMQAWLGAYGHYVRVDLDSGLRTPATNKKIEHAAQNSLHLPDENMVFRAADIILPTIPANYIGKLALYASQGGVGFYPNSHFTHVDTGPLTAGTGRRRIWTR